MSEDIVVGRPEPKPFMCPRCSKPLKLTCQSCAEAELTTLRERVGELEGALKPFAQFAEAWAKKPLGGMDDEVYRIHPSTPYDASLRLSDCEVALSLLPTSEEDQHP